MKRKNIVFLTLLSLLITTTVVVTAVISVSAADSGYMRGDADGDGSVSITDATVIQRKLAQLPVSAFNEKAADVDGNGLDITDATKIQRYLAEYSDPYHIGETVSNNTQPTTDEYELPFIPV